MADSGTFGSECLTDYTTCEVHKKEQIVKYCNSHNVLICKLCEISCHSSCVKLSSRDAAKESSTKTSNDDFLKPFLDIESKIRILQTEQEIHKDSLQEKIQKCHAEVKETRRKIDARFDKLEDSLTKLGQTMLESVEGRIKACDHTIRELDKEMRRLKTFVATNDDESVFVGRTKALSSLGNIEQVYGNLKSTFVTKFPEVLIRSQVLKVAKLQDLGKVAETLNVDTSIDGEHSTVCGSTFLPDGRLVAVSRLPEALLLFDTEGNRLSTMRVEPYEVYNVAVMSADTLVATVPDHHEIHLIRVEGTGLQPEKKIKTIERYYGIGALGSNLYVTTKDEIVVLSLDGTPLVRWNKSTGDSCNITKPVSVCVDKTNEAVFVADAGTRKIIVITDNGRKIHQLITQEFTSIDGLDRTSAICRYSDNTFIVAVKNRICMLTYPSMYRGRRLWELCLQTDTFGLGYLGTVSFRESDEALFVKKNSFYERFQPGRILWLH